MHEGAVERSSCLRRPAWGLFVADAKPSGLRLTQQCSVRS